jgi:glycine cleavage system H protein
MSDHVKNFNHHLWYTESEGIITIGINDEGLADITEINSVDLPPEQEKVDTDLAFGSIETDDGTLDLFSPIEGTIIEVNSQVLEDPSIIMEDPYEEGWLVRIEAEGEIEDVEEEDEDDDDDLEEEEDEDEESDKDDER